MRTQKIAVVTGAKRGLGLATAEALAHKNYTVVLVGRGKSELEKAVLNLKSQGLDVFGFEADVTSEKDAKNLAGFIAEKFGHLDVLVNNAGVFTELRGDSHTFTTPPEVVIDVFKTNTVGTMIMTNALAELLKKSGDARVVNVSSGMGQLSEMNGSYPGYRLSKTAMNALTKIYSEDFGETVKVNSVCPGWVKTEMGGTGADREIEEGISGILWAAMLPKNGPTGGFFRDGERLDW